MREARTLLEDAHSVNPDHLEAVYNLHTKRWEDAETSDREVIGHLESLKIESPATPDYKHLLGLIHLQRGEPEVAASLLREACDEGSQYKSRWNAQGGDPVSFVRSLGLRAVGEEKSLAGHVKDTRDVAFAQTSRGRLYQWGKTGRYGSGTWRAADVSKTSGRSPLNPWQGLFHTMAGSL